MFGVQFEWRDGVRYSRHAIKTIKINGRLAVAEWSDWQASPPIREQ